MHSEDDNRKVIEPNGLVSEVNVQSNRMLDRLLCRFDWIEFEHNL